MNKEEYVQLHKILAKLKYELEIQMLEVDDFDYIKELKKQSKAIDEVMKIFIVDCE